MDKYVGPKTSETRHMAELPGLTNICCSVQTALRPEAIAKRFAPPVWRVRKCSWTDFEAVSDFAEVVIESSNPVLVHGPVADVTVNSLRVVEPLIAAGFSGSFECYDESDVLILEAPFGAVGNGRT